MSGTDFLARCGFFVQPHALDSPLCRTLIDDMRAAPGRAAHVYDGESLAVDEHVRRTKLADVRGSSRAAVDDMLVQMRPRLSKHFDFSVNQHEPVDFLVYREGDFFEAHADNGGPGDDRAPVVRARQISVVMFLNDEVGGDEPGQTGFSGGALTFYGVLDDPRAREFGVPLRAETGLLVAFRSGIRHEVSIVTAGERFTAVTFLA